MLQSITCIFISKLASASLQAACTQPSLVTQSGDTAYSKANAHVGGLRANDASADMSRDCRPSRAAPTSSSVLSGESAPALDARPSCADSARTSRSFGSFGTQKPCSATECFSPTAIATARRRPCTRSGLIQCPLLRGNVVRGAGGGAGGCARVAAFLRGARAALAAKLSA